MTELDVCKDLLIYIKSNSNAYEILLRYFNNYRYDNLDHFTDNVPTVILNMTFKYFKEIDPRLSDLEINDELENCFKQMLSQEFENWRT